jgi:hypothetical protein
VRGNLDLTRLVQDKDQRRALVNTVMNKLSVGTGYYLVPCAAIDSAS